MNWRPTYGDIMSLMFLLAGLAWLREFLSSGKIKGILRAGLRRADTYGLAGRDTVRFDRNQIAELLGLPVDTYRGAGFSGKADPVHPSMRSPVRRRKLRR
jgi:hypothetical protein